VIGRKLPRLQIAVKEICSGCSLPLAAAGILKKVLTNVDEVREVRLHVRHVNSLAERHVERYLVPGTDDATSRGEVVNETETQRAIPWHVDANGGPCRLSEMSSMSPQHEAAVERESVLSLKQTNCSTAQTVIRRESPVDNLAGRESGEPTRTTQERTQVFAARVARWNDRWDAVASVEILHLQI
jgi:hypothetical protein